MPSAPETATPVSEESAGLRSSGTSPVAVVWCRQVDNEAESPGYTTVPEEFPGQRETLEAIRIVGNLTINVADTHDYWDPDPSQPLSYYPNLFLYPAFGGKYTCLGRMFLSTEDRPRLGMKTLVLETQPLLASGDFGGTILRWHDSMGGARGDGGRPPPSPDPILYDLLGEGFLFHKGATEPVLVVASGEWDAGMEVVRDLVHYLPASLVALGAILVFPYFLPQPKTNLHEFTEQMPLAFAMMRVPRAEAAGERHEKRMASWESAPVTLRDLTDGLPAPPKGKDTTPNVLQFIREHNESKLEPIVQRVDLVEGPRLKAHLADPDRQAGRDRRKEMWRIGTAMESAAILMARSRGRHVPVSGETAKRAQEYLHARLPEPEAEPEPAEAPAPDDFAIVEPENGARTPAWLQAEAGPANDRPRGPEVVPLSVQDDPSMLSAAARAAAPPPPGAPGPTPPLARPPAAAPTPAGPRVVSGMPGSLPPAAIPAPPLSPSRAATPPAPATPVSAADLTALRQQISSELLRLIDERIAAQVAKSPAPATDPALRAALEARLEELRTSLAKGFNDQLMQLHDRLQRQLSAAELSQQESWPGLVAAEIAKMREELLADQGRGEEALRQSLAADQARGEESLRQALAAAQAHSEESLRQSLSTQVDLHLREAADRENVMRENLTAQLEEGLEKGFTGTDVRHANELKELEQRLGAHVEGRVRDLHDRVLQKTKGDNVQLQRTIDERLTEQGAKVAEQAEAVRTELQEGQVHAIADLQIRLQAYTDQKLVEDADRERQKYIELLARLKSELDGSIARLLDSPKFDGAVRERILRQAEAAKADLQRVFDARVAQAEDALRVVSSDAAEQVERVEGALKERQEELVHLEESIRGDLDDVDRRTQILADRLVPIVRKTWLRISELEEKGPSGPAADVVAEVRREFQREVRRVEDGIEERLTEVRDRMETAISNQGRVWLTLVRQLSQLTEDRRVIEQSRAMLQQRPAEPEPEADEATNLEALPSLLQPRSRDSASRSKVKRRPTTPASSPRASRADEADA